MKIYLAGPMRGHDQFNFPAFIQAAEYIRSFGIEVASPAQHDIEMGFDWEHAESWDGLDLKTSLTWDFEQVMHLDAVVVLPGWETSKGVAAELAVAAAVGTPVYEYCPSGYLLFKTDLEGKSDIYPAGPLKLYPFKPFATPPVPERAITRQTPTTIPRTLLEAVANEREISPERWTIPDTGEVRVTDPDTGASKGSKLARFDLLPWDALYQLAEHFGVGARKYEDRNWERGYPWSLSIAALGRHLAAWLSGESIDSETGHSHMVAVAWHALALLTFEKTHPDKDDRVGHAASR